MFFFFYLKSLLLGARSCGHLFEHPLEQFYNILQDLKGKIQKVNDQSHT